jgi:hypothetical protein
MEDYYILCPTRPEQEPALISHLISRDICEKRQSENFHKCPNCVRSRIWQDAHPGGERAAPAPSAGGEGGSA